MRWSGDRILDIGEETEREYTAHVKDAKTVFWNGPLGLFEQPEFAHGTLAIARAMADATARGAITVVGGGESVQAIEQLGLADKITHVSTGGGAALELIEGKKLPGVEAIPDV